MRRRNILTVAVVILLSCNFAVLVEAEALTGWSKTYGAGSASSLIETPDGGLLAAGTTTSFGGGGYDFWLIKTSATGYMEWNRTYGGRDDESASSLVATSDGGYAIAGQISPYDVAGRDALLVKIDADGNMMWNRTYEGKGYDGASSVVQARDGGYAIAGATSTEQVGTSYCWLVKTDESGNVEWSKTYSSEGSINSLVATSDGGYVMVGTTGSSATAIILMIKINERGNMEWRETYGDKLRNVASSVVETTDGGYVIAGVTNHKIDWIMDERGFITSIEVVEDFTLIKTDEQGVVEWSNTYGNGEASSVVQTPDGGYAMVGGTHFVKTNSTGHMEWNQTLHQGEGDSLIVTADGGYAIAGSRNSLFWLVKTGEEGDIPEFPSWAMGDIPEFPSWAIIPLVLAVTLFSVIIKVKLSRVRNQ